MILQTILVLPLLFAASSSLPERYRRWLDQEVPTIIAAEERASFLRLSTDAERDAFVERFWMIRDTDPSTEENEFRSEHYGRIRHANERFAEGIPGWKTDRGRIWILHGPPDDMRYEYGGGTLSIDVENPTEVLTGDGNPDRRRNYRLTFNRPETEIWVYRRLQTARSFPSYFEIIFSRTDPTRVYELGQFLRRITSGGNLSYAERVQRDRAIQTFLKGHFFGGPHRILYAGEYRFQDLDEFYLSVFQPRRLPSVSVSDFQQGIQDLERSTGELLMEKIAAGRALKEKVQARIFFEELPLEMRAATLRSRSGTPMVRVELAFEPREGVGPILPGSDTLDILVELEKDGEVAAWSADSIRVKPDGGDGSLRYQAQLAARPGTYLLKVWAALRGRKASGMRAAAVDLPDFAAGRLAMSDILLFDRVVPKETYRDAREGRHGLPQFVGSASPVLLKEHALIPSSAGRFRRTEKLTAFFEAYNFAGAGRDKAPALKVRARVCRAGEAVELQQSLVDYVTSADGRTTYGISIPLTGFGRGDYTLQFELFDPILDQSVTRSAEFTVE